MDEDRILRLVTTELSNDYMKHEETLQGIINSDKDGETKVREIKETLYKMSMCTQSLNIWTNLTAGGTNNEETNNEADYDGTDQ